MKKLFCLLTLFAISFAFSQQKATPLQITLLEKSKAPLSTHIHKHTYSIKNSTNEAIEYTIVTKQVDCKRKSSKMSVNIHSSTHTKLSKVLIKANTSKTFTVELQRNYLTKLDTWSCTEISATNQHGNPISNTVTLTQFIPDTKKFQ
ncbi:MAG: hypothetical protein ACPG45_09615 [Flavobacteriaceae bacterium]